MGGYNSVAIALILLLLAIAVARTKTGYTILYYVVLSSILIVWAIGSPKIADIFKGG